ncbi:MAG: DUF4157 domain-containing protein [Burkholderiaceae bacterium]
MSTTAPMQIHAARSQASDNSNHAGLLLQRKCACGSPTSSLTGECAECISRKRPQTKLAIGASNDPQEQEADRVADQVLAAPGNLAVSGAPPRIQRYPGQVTGQADTAAASVERVLASPGTPLEPALRLDMEQRFGHDFSRVQVHSDGAAEQSARDVNADAYTVGHDVVFGAGQFAPEADAGRRLIAHELTHVVQQSGTHFVMPLQRAPVKSPAMKPIPALQPLEVVARDVADLILKNYSGKGIAAGPVLTAVLDEVTGKIYIGLNSGIPPAVADVVMVAIQAQKDRIKAAEVIVVRTDPLAQDGHSETNAVNEAVRAREVLLKRNVTETDLRTFELHNIWLKGADRKFTAAPRCEHCARITRSVSVTSSVFFAEGGVSGEIKPSTGGGQRNPRVGPGGATGSISGEIPEKGGQTPKSPASGAASSKTEPTTAAANEEKAPGGNLTAKTAGSETDISPHAIESSAGADQQATADAVGGAAVMIHQGQVAYLQNAEQAKAEDGFKKIEPEVDRLVARGQWVVVRFHFDAPRAPSITAGVFKEQSDINRFVMVTYHHGDTKEEALGKETSSIKEVLGPPEYYDAPKKPLGADRTTFVSDERIYKPDYNPGRIKGPYSLWDLIGFTSFKTYLDAKNKRVLYVRWEGADPILSMIDISTAERYDVWTAQLDVKNQRINTVYGRTSTSETFTSYFLITPTYLGELIQRREAPSWISKNEAVIWDQQKS